MNNKKSIGIMAGVLSVLVLAGCDSSEHFVIKADSGQIGAGATISMTGKTGRLHTDPLPGHPAGLDQAVAETDKNVPMSSMWELQTEKKMTLRFVVSQGKYICTTCDTWELPVQWHREKS